MDKENVSAKVKDGASSVRIRTWTLTLAICVLLVFYFLVQVTTKSAINVVDFVFVCSLQIIAHCLYFPEGDLFGQRNTTFISNKNAYNTRATEINQNKKIARLRKYCQYDYEERKKRYILNECGALGITENELEILKHLSKKQIKKLTRYEFTSGDNEELSKFVFFSPLKRKRLFNLIFKSIPVEPNHADTILSAVGNDGTSAVQDSSIGYRAKSYTKRVLQSVLIGGVLAYIGYTVRDGVGITEVVQILMYLTSLFSTAVLSFSSGETCSKVYKSRFYIDLVNFIDAFNEWDSANA